MQFNKEDDDLLLYTMSYVEGDDWNSEYCVWESATGDLAHKLNDEPPTEIFLIYAPQEKITWPMNFGQWWIAGWTLFKYFDVSFSGGKFDGDAYCYENGAATEESNF